MKSNVLVLLATFGIMCTGLLYGSEQTDIYKTISKSNTTVYTISNNDTFTLTSVVTCGSWMFGSDYTTGRTTTHCFRSSDKGLTWTPVVIDSVFGTSQRFVSANGNCVFAVSALGLFRSTDYGLHWYIVNNTIRLYSIESENVTSCVIKNKRMICTWNDGSIASSNDLGLTWSVRKKGVSQSKLANRHSSNGNTIVCNTRKL